MTTTTPSGADAVREAFEKWAQPITALARNGDRYEEAMTSLAWEAWRACAATKPVGTDIPRASESLLCRLMNVRIIGSGRLPPVDIQTINDAIEALSAAQAAPAQAAQAVPDGFRLVSVAMLTRWKDAFAEELSAWDLDPPIHHVQVGFDETSAMLAAAPSAPQPAAQQAGAANALSGRALKSADELDNVVPQYDDDDVVLDEASTVLRLVATQAQEAAPAAQGEPSAEQALRKILEAIRRYLPPDGPSARDTITEIIALVDPWPLGDPKGPK